MASVLTQCKKLFGTKDIYKLFNISKDATQDQLKKGYYKVSLKVHPDKVAVKDRQLSTEKFQLLSKVFKLMSDMKRRQIYDKTGELEDDADDFGMSSEKEWLDYWRELFPPITVKDITKFHDEYKGSDEELSALKQAYLDSKGDMQKIIDSVMCASNDDDQRFRDILMPLIQKKELPRYKKFTDESAASKKRRLAKAKSEAKEAKRADMELQSGSKPSDLVLAIQRNKGKRGGLISYLEEKYASKEGDEDSEDEVKTKTSSKNKKRVKSSRTSSQPPTSKRQKSK